MKQLLLLRSITNLAYAKESLKKRVWNSLSLTFTNGSLCSWLLLLLLLFTILLLLASILGNLSKFQRKFQMQIMFRTHTILILI